MRLHLTLNANLRNQVFPESCILATFNVCNLLEIEQFICCGSFLFPDRGLNRCDVHDCPELSKSFTFGFLMALFRFPQAIMNVRKVSASLYCCSPLMFDNLWEVW